MHFDDLEDEADAQRSARRSALATLRRFGPALAPHRGRLALGFVFLAVATAGDLGGPFVLRALIDRAIPSGDTSRVLSCAGLFLALFALARASEFAQLALLVRTGLDLVAALKKRTFRHLLGLSLHVFDRTAPGRLMARVESDAERLLPLFSDVGAAILGTLFLLAGTLAVMFATDPLAGALVTGLCLPIAVGNYFYLGFLTRYFVAARKVYATVSAFLAEYIPAIPLVQVLGIEGPVRERLALANRRKLEAERKAFFLEHAVWGALDGAQVAIVLALLVVGARAVSTGSLTLGTLVLFVEYVRRMFMPIIQLSEQLNQVQRALAAADRVFAILDEETLTPDRDDGLERAPTGWRELRFERVSFAYEPGGRRAVDGVDLTIRRGERVALVGASGGGKTTLVSLLLRFYDPTDGRITLDGLDIRDYRLAAWRRTLGLVLQEITLFPGTIAENLRIFSEGVADAELTRALELVEARAIIDRLPRGLATEVAEGGANLSLGERQLLSFARAVLRDPMILVLDEATSSVDPGTEHRIQRSLERLLAGRTAIMIAHRLETARGADRIVVVERGRIVEEGTHADLHARGGAYRALCDHDLRGRGAAGTPPGPAPREEAPAAC